MFKPEQEFYTQGKSSVGISPSQILFPAHNLTCATTWRNNSMTKTLIFKELLLPLLTICILFQLANPSRVNSVNNGSSSRRFESSEHELRGAFSIPRNGGSLADGPSTSVGSINEIVPTSTGSTGSIPISSLSAGYSHLQNYSQGRAKPRKGKDQSRSTTTGRFEKGRQQKGKKQSAEQLSFKDVCLLPSPHDTLPRMKAKAELIGQGLYIDAFTLMHIPLGFVFLHCPGVARGGDNSIIVQCTDVL